MPAGEVSDDSARGPNTSGCRSQWPWLRSSTTPRTVLSWWSSTTLHRDRSQPGQGPARSTSPWATRACGSRLGSFSCKLGWGGTSWKTWELSAHSCRFSIFLCRRWWTTWRTPCGFWIARLPSKLWKFPRFLARCVLLVLLYLCRSQRNGWWKCRPSCLLCASRIRSLALQFLLVVASGVFKVSSQNRVQRKRLLWNAFLSGMWSRSLPFLLVADEDFTGDFSHFLMEKVRSAGQVVSAQLGGHVSSSTLSANQMVRAGEPVDSDGSIEWVMMRDGDTGQTFGWNRRTNSIAWNAPAGVEAVWVAEKNARGSV